VQLNAALPKVPPTFSTDPRYLDRSCAVRVQQCWLIVVVVVVVLVDCGGGMVVVVESVVWVNLFVKRFFSFKQDKVNAC
jgi:hypothetical protein